MGTDDAYRAIHNGHKGEQRCVWCGNEKEEELKMHRSGNGWICIDDDSCVQRANGSWSEDTP